MSDFKSFIKKNSRIRIESIRDDIVARRDPHFFWPSGTQVYVGRQGSGKTISAVKHILDIKKRYPKAILVSNIKLNDYEPRLFTNEEDLKLILQDIDTTKQYILFSDMEQLALSLVGVNNGKYGVVYAVDEIHTYFNALDSKNIPMYVFTEISQQRKQRKVIIGTSQLFLRMAKPFREQCDSLIICSTYLGAFTTQKVYDGMTLEQQYDGSLTGDLKKRGWFWHTRKIRNAFDTFQKVVSGIEQYENQDRVIVTDKKTAKKFGVR